jgi:beta-aspartyl-dipeptidase (metallo-type)
VYGTLFSKPHGGAPLVLIRGAELWDPSPRGLQDLLVAGGVIAAISPGLVTPAGLAVEEVEGTGLRLIPGLIDAHTHITGGGGEGGPHTKVPPVDLSAFTTAGVTTVVGLLGTDGRTRSVAELLAAARALEILGLSAFCYTGGYEVPPVTLTGSARDDLVHVDRIIAVGETAISDHRSSQPTFEEIVRLAADCHVAGLLTGKAGLLHLHLGDGARGLEMIRRALDETELPARVFHPTHVNRNRRLWAEAKAIAKDRGLTVDLTAFPDEEGVPTAASDLAEWFREGLPAERLTLSSDGGGCLPTFSPEGTLLHMDVGRSETLLSAIAGALALGAPLEGLLATATRNVARQFRMADRGELRVGMRADLALVDGDLRPVSVMAGGRWLVRGGLPTVRGPFEGRR